MGMMFVSKIRKSLRRAQVKSKQLKKKVSSKKRQMKVKVHQSLHSHEADSRKINSEKKVYEKNFYQIIKKMLGDYKYRHTGSSYQFVSLNNNGTEADLMEESQANNIVTVRNVEMAAGTELPILNELPSKVQASPEQAAKPDIASKQSDLNGTELGNEGPPNQDMPDYDTVVQFRGDEEVHEIAEPEEVHEIDESEEVHEIDESEEVHEIDEPEEVHEIDEPDEWYSMQLQKEQTSDIEAPLESVLDELPVEEESPFSLKQDPKDNIKMEDQSVIQMKELKYDQNLLFDANSSKSCIETEEKEYMENEQSAERSLNELKKLVKNSPGLTMITRSWKILLKKLTKQFFKKCSLEKCYLQTYQKTIFNPANFRPEKMCLGCHAVRYDGLTVIPACVANEIIRLLSFANVEVDPEHPVILRLARDGFFNDNRGLIYCFFCGTMIQNNLLQSSQHDQLINFLDNHCNRCVRRNNIPADEYGSSVNLADIMADYIPRLFVVVPSGTQYLEEVGRRRCLLARWIQNIGAQIIIPSGCTGMRPSQALPLPAALSPNLVSPANNPYRLSSIQEVVTPPQSFRSHIDEEEIEQQLAEYAEQNPQEAEVDERRISLQFLSTGEEDVIQQEVLEVRAETSENSGGQVTLECLVGEGMVDNTHEDTERELPEISSASMGSAIEKEKTRGAGLIENGNLTTAGTVTVDYLTGAAAAVGFRVSEMADLDLRIESFNRCKNKFSQTPQAMALAGLFCLGEGDMVRCHVCGGCMKQWQKSDVPLLEHIRNFPECEFVWNIVIDMQMCDDPMMPMVIAAFADSRGGIQAQNDGYTREQVFDAVNSLIFNREKVTYNNIVSKLQEMDVNPGRT